jgi:hypothetical protein
LYSGYGILFHTFHTRVSYAPFAPTRDCWFSQPVLLVFFPSGSPASHTPELIWRQFPERTRFPPPQSPAPTPTFDHRRRPRPGRPRGCASRPPAPPFLAVNRYCQYLIHRCPAECVPISVSCNCLLVLGHRHRRPKLLAFGLPIPRAKPPPEGLHRIHFSARPEGVLFNPTFV